VAFSFSRRDTCPTCHSPGAAPIVDLPFDRPPLTTYLHAFYGGRVSPEALVAGRYALVDCTNCGLLYQRDVPGPELLRFLYSDGILLDGDAGRAARGLQVRRGYAFQVEEMLKYFGAHPADVRVLDYGMGWGNWLQMAQAYGCHAAGADLSGTRAGEPAPGIEVLAHDELPAEGFDFVNTEQVFEHLVEPAPRGDRLVAALRPGGILRISVPNGGNVRALLADPDWSAPKDSPCSLNAVAPLEHLNCFTHESLKWLGEQRLRLVPMRYPTRQFFEPWERIRFAASALLHALRRPKGTMLLFRKP